MGRGDSGCEGVGRGRDSGCEGVGTVGVKVWGEGTVGVKVWGGGGTVGVMLCWHMTSYGPMVVWVTVW